MSNAPIMNHPARRRAPQYGSTLVEVLVTMVILAFGLLGLAGLLVKGTSMAFDSYERTMAVQRIYALADRMRLNQAGVQAATPAYNFSGDPGSPPSCGTACNATQIAQLDYYQWTQDLKNTLAGSSGSVQPNGAKTGLFTITVNWIDPKVVNSSGVPLTQTYSLNVRP